MNKKGFTLIELLGVILIISLLVIIVLPRITNSVNNFSTKTDKLMMNMIEDAAKLYVEDNENKFPKNSNNSYCITINQLVDNEYLKQGIEISGKDISNTKSLQITYDSDYHIQLVDIDDCIDYKDICKLISGEINKIGSKYQCKVKENMETGFEDGYYFYVLSSDDNGKTNLIMDRNICDDGTIATAEKPCVIPWISKLDFISAGATEEHWNNGERWNENNGGNYWTSFGPITAMNHLYNATKDWVNISNIEINYEDEYYGGIQTSQNKTVITRLNGDEVISYTNLKSRLPEVSEVKDVGCNNNFGSCPSWLSEYLEDASVGFDGVNMNKIFGYWTSASNSHYAKYVDSSIGDSLTDVYFSGGYIGVRPVITLPSNYLTIQSN